MKLSVLALVFAVVLAACSSSHIVHYDRANLDGDILGLEARTREMVEDGDKGRLSAEASHRFLEQSKAMADLIRVRVNRKQQLAHLAALDQEYRALLGRPGIVLRSS